MAHNFCLEFPICISLDSFEILRFSVFIWEQEKGHFIQKQLRKLCLKCINEDLFLLLSWHCHIFGYCHVSLHISDNLSPNLISSDITGKQRSRAFIWHQAWLGYRLYWWRYGVLKRGARFVFVGCTHGSLSNLSCDHRLGDRMLAGDGDGYHQISRRARD